MGSCGFPERGFRLGLGSLTRRIPALPLATPLAAG
jgi:hypothetical protein